MDEKQSAGQGIRRKEIGFRERCVKKWESFQARRPKAAKLIYQLFYFWVFSMGVTVFQYLMFTFLPYLFGSGLAGTEFMWPQIPVHISGFHYKWNILGYEVARNAAGEVQAEGFHEGTGGQACGSFF